MTLIRHESNKHKIDRTPMEFTDQTKLEALKRADFKCEDCGRTKAQLREDGEKGYFEIHHRLPIYIIASEFPELSLSVIKSLANAEVLCQKCHAERHRTTTFEEYEAIADELKTKQDMAEKFAQSYMKPNRKRI